MLNLTLSSEFHWYTIHNTEDEWSEMIKNDANVNADFCESEKPNSWEFFFHSSLTLFWFTILHIHRPVNVYHINSIEFATSK